LIRGCNINDEDFHLILKYLETNSTLESLDLMYNDITNEGCSLFEKFLLNRKNSNVKSFYLGANKQITKEGIAYIAQGMINNTFVQELSLQAMEMDDSYSGIILSLLGDNNLQSLNFSNNSFSDTSILVWEEALKQNSHLVELNLCGNKLKDQSAKIFSNLLKNHPSLVLIDVKANEFTKDGLKNFYETFEKNEKIKFIDVYGNGNNLNDFVDKFRKLNVKRRQFDSKM
jgi:Ran GTPase-activating protein (RanGAP) involved in mRNA processing and transport